ncbi:MAG: hypothetical protein PVH26_04075, partial [Desulfosarcina sp.]
MTGHASSATAVPHRRRYPRAKGYHHPHHESIDNGAPLFVDAIAHGIFSLIGPLFLYFITHNTQLSAGHIHMDSLKFNVITTTNP